MMDLSQLPVGEGVRRRLENSLNRLSHAYIISGPPESGASTLADLLAAAYVCSGTGDRPCGVCPGCRKAKGNIHPDIIRLTVPEGKRNITVEQVRQLRADAYVRPNEAHRKVFLIEDAQAMNDSAQNALLKVLEDGPDYLSFLLLAENSQQLLPTIRSRCETLRAAGEETAEASQEGETLARFILSGAGPVETLPFLLSLEKKDREDIALLLEDAHGRLVRALPQRPDLLPLLDRMEPIRRACDFNISAGHLTGWLASIL